MSFSFENLAREARAATPGSVTRECFDRYGLVPRSLLRCDSEAGWVDRSDTRHSENGGYRRFAPPPTLQIALYSPRSARRTRKTENWISKATGFQHDLLFLRALRGLHGCRLCFAVK